jgi:peptide-methionine (S)-S-oxide reductase
VKTEKIYLAGGCFWCLEASFKLVLGVVRVSSGYAGGTLQNPTYEQVCTGKTGHAEVVEIEYDPEITTFYKLLDIFFKVHDSSQENRQGSDIGTQYRSAIFYVNGKQRDEANNFIKGLRDASEYNTIYTKVEKLTDFWTAEEYHQGYFEKHPSEAYCQAVIRPKIEKITEYLENN